MDNIKDKCWCCWGEYYSRFLCCGDCAWKYGMTDGGDSTNFRKVERLYNDSSFKDSMSLEEFGKRLGLL